MRYTGYEAALALYNAIADGDDDRVWRMLESGIGASYFEPDGSASSLHPLLAAVRHRKVGIIYLLLQYPSFPLHPNKSGKNAVDYAIEGKDPAVMQALKPFIDQKIKEQQEAERQAALAKAEEKRLQEKAARRASLAPVLQVVEAGDVEKMRQLFNEAFLKHKTIKMEREYLEAALQQEDRAMLQLFITWGATMTMDDVKKIPDPSKHDGYVKKLRACGLRLPRVGA